LVAATKADEEEKGGGAATAAASAAAAAADDDEWDDECSDDQGPCDREYALLRSPSSPRRLREAEEGDFRRDLESCSVTEGGRSAAAYSAATEPPLPAATAAAARGLNHKFDVGVIRCEEEEEDGGEGRGEDDE
jgi:hypothetical protein